MCSIDAKCGFGCQLHRISWCMIHAVMENRTMVMRPNAIREYGRDTECGSHWNCWFDNVSGCQVYAAARKSSLKDQKDFKTYSENPFTKHKDWLPPVLVERGLKNMTEMPTAWFVGQIVGWLLKYADELNATIEDFKAEMNLTRPVDVSLHVRRTDKVQAHRGEQTEAASHTFQEYMQHVDHLIYPNARHHDYYAEHEHTPVNIYVATDDPTLPNDFSNYPRYNFIYDERGMALASKQNTRYNAESLDRLLLDLRMMSEAEFFVGTFSSQISRIVVELMMARGLPDVPRRVHSVDAVYYAAE
ncbi:hypothetical protein SARC_05816 [Sphaeroforma arctica JP610]|uniref:GT23 domain-containing protein n=1 Tax=Sphaeroforma arctica JP610 TaxID=667725 RepID=A0A0L0FYH4_9EUKA|nr:hypothetical protein SARC_05816 [Sphaeroforma arctica JP610]KNC81885.1 hypothetical protein SARC_05816 [Sphaeroforma arctica JP610]|eukprot:XP_014155787.1 hypothetical protein SARC_05816 [Sphaeroforma arctica JP610]